MTPTSQALYGMYLNTDLQTMMNGEMTPEDVAANAQAAYEAELLKSKTKAEALPG